MRGTGPIPAQAHDFTGKCRNENMNWNAFAGIGLVFSLVYFVIIRGAGRPEIFFDHHALLLVIGGTFSIMVMSFKKHQIESLHSLFFYGWLFKSRRSPETIIKRIVTDAHFFKNGESLPLSEDGKDRHPFLQEGYQLIHEGVLKGHELEAVLKKRKEFYKTSYAEDSKALSSLAKYPPALGLLGATHGMIMMLTNFGSGGKEKIGLGMATALVATLWGIAVANLIILPLADYADRLGEEDARMRDLIAEGLLMIERKELPDFILEQLNSHLRASQRLSFQQKSRFDRFKRNTSA
jgi:chemotaxis protein MotA